MIIFLISYYIGMMFYVFSDVLNDLKQRDDYDKNNPSYNHEDFITYQFNGVYSLDDKSSSDITIIMVYYAFTSLSTVGFGDYHPRSDAERLFIAAVLLIGVSTFSYIMGNLIEIIDEIKLIEAEIDDGDNLAKFFGLIRRFNADKQLPTRIQDEIEDFFVYKWNQDRNQAVETDKDKELLEQLPYDV